MNTWYTIKNSSDQQNHEISIHDDIGMWGISAAEFIADFKQIPVDAHINLSMHCYGGNVFDGLAIYNVLARESHRITATVEGVAASAASIILMAAGKIIMPEGSFIMIHEAWSSLFGGEAKDFLHMSDLLDQINAQLAGIYCRRTGLKDGEVRALMAEESWLTASTAKEKGFCDEVQGELKIAASCSRYALSNYRNIPAAIAKPDQVATVQEKESVVDTKIQDEQTDVRASAEQIIAACKQANEAALIPFFNAEEITVQALEQRLTEVAAIRACAAIGQCPELADKLIEARTPLEVARDTILTHVQTKSETAAINKASTQSVINGCRPEAKKDLAQQLDPINVYAKLTY